MNRQDVSPAGLCSGTAWHMASVSPLLLPSFMTTKCTGGCLLTQPDLLTFRPDANFLQGVYGTTKGTDVLHWQESAINPPKTHKQRDINTITAAAGFNATVEIKLGVP